MGVWHRAISSSPPLVRVPESGGDVAIAAELDGFSHAHKDNRSAADYLAIAAGIGNVTFPVAAHSAPRANVVMNAGV